MNEAQVTILGASGMLGSACKIEFPDAYCPTRKEFDALVDTPNFQGWVINCIGAIPQRISDSEITKKLNSEFPKKLKNCKVIQILTDCVYSGATGFYNEDSPKDAIDQYGLSKIAGEDVDSLRIRCSIIGPDLTNASLFGWVKSQPHGATINGYTDHIWNGVTTKVFAKLAHGIIKDNFQAQNILHFVPENSVSKFELVNLIAQRLGRDDLEIIPVTTSAPKNMTLTTNYPDINLQLWQMAGYEKPLTIEQMVADIDF